MPLPGRPAPMGAPPVDMSTEIERIRRSVSTYFPVYETRITPTSLVLLVHAEPSTLEFKFDRLRQDLWKQFYVPQVRFQGGEYLIEVVRRPNRTGWGRFVNVVLLAMTIATTMTAGALLWVAYVGGSTLSADDFFYGGLEFSLPLLLILGGHELAHYLVAKRHHVDASLPFFIPVPPPFILFGTFGAFISLREPIPDKKALLDIGASGPLAGFVIALPVTFLGLFLSAHAPVLSVANCGPTVFGVPYGNFGIGGSLFWYVIGLFGPAGLLNLSPVALAGWVGLLVTAINLLPAGQLDGGHVFRALLGDRSRYVSYAAVALLFLLGILAYQGWLIFGVLILFLGMRHPPPLNDLTPLDPKRLGVGLVVVGILLSGFVLVPIMTPTNSFSISGTSISELAPPTGYAMSSNVSLTIDNLDFVPHGFYVSGTIETVLGTVDNRSTTLNGSELASFEANSSWTILLPDGNVSMLTGTGGFDLPGASYFSVSGGDSATATVSFSDSESAVVVLEITVNELCTGSPPTSHTSTFTLQ